MADQWQPVCRGNIGLGVKAASEWNLSGISHSKVRFLLSLTTTRILNWIPAPSPMPCSAVPGNSCGLRSRPDRNEGKVELGEQEDKLGRV